MLRIAVFSGSFDPITIGHEDIALRATSFFDKVIIAVGENIQKKCLFTLEQRIEFLKVCFKNNEKIEIDCYQGLTSEYCQKKNALIIRGIRNVQDFQYENEIAQTNKMLFGVETVFIPCTPHLSCISSSIFRDIYLHGGDYTKLLPSSVVIK